MNTLNLSQFFPYQLSRLEQHISQTIAQHYIKGFNLSRMEWRVMATVAMFNSTTAKHICEFTGMEKMQVSRAIKRMQQIDLVEHKMNSQDRRSSQISLTHTGLELYQKILPLVKKEEQHILSMLTKSEQNQLRHIIDKLENSLGYNV